MKDNSLDGHRGKVALSETTHPAAAAAATTLKGDGTTNFDDDYNEWELGIGDLIIDLDADIEKTNGGETTLLGMSSKSCSFEHQATVDKGLKMKIKRKTVGSRYEAKHEIVQPPPDEKRRAGHKKSRAAASSNGRATTDAPSPAASPGRVPPPPGSPLAEPSANLPPSGGSPPMPNLTVKLENGAGAKFATSPAAVPQVAPTAAPPQKVVPTPVPVVQQQQQVVEERPASPPLKKQKLDPAAPVAAEGNNDEDECPPGSPSSPPEMKDTSTCTSVGTAVEPDCLGPCEPGTSVMLEGIVWQETEGGVLVVNVTWRGKTYVGTLLDCTKHDWAPPRFCESPTSDADSKTSKGRGGKRGGARGTELSFDARNCVQSKLRNGKGRRTTVNSNGFTVPSSPAKDGSGGGKRKSRPSSEPPSESSKRSRPQQQQQPSAAAASTTAELITCPEPNCNKRYKHLNGLKYHRAHAHSGGGDKTSASAEEAADTDNSKATNSSDNEEGSLQESASVSTSPAPSSSDAPPPTKASETSSSSSGLPDDPTSTELPPPQPQDVPMDVSVDAAPAIAIEAAVSAVTTSVITSSSSISDAPQPPHAFSQLSPAAAPPFPPAASPPAPCPLMDNKSKTKQDRPPVVDKYKPKSPSSSSTVVVPAPNIRPIVPAPLITLSPAALPPGGGALLNNPALKPIQPKPTILGEPSTVNPALESLKKDKSGSSKHKNKKSSSSKGEKKPLVLPLSCDPLELTTTSSYPSLEAASPLATPKEDMSLPADDPMNENIQSPAYSDISDANDTAPVLESEVGGGKEKEDKVGKSTPDAAQSPASASISGAYGMYPYYSQPPYLLPSVSPDNKVVVAAAASVEPPKKVVDPVKERTWSSPGVVVPQQSHPPEPPPHHELLDKRAQQAPSSLQQQVPPQGSRESPAAAVPEYPVPQHYPYPYGYVQGYPYPVDASPYHHMQMLENDPHYKQQYKQYVEEHNRLYKEQQHHQHQQQLHQQQHHHHQSSSSSHHHSSSQHHHHQSSKSSHHSSVIKEEHRKEREKQKEVPSDVVREMEMRPPSLKEKQSETHQILKENIELKSQMEEGGGGKGKANQYEMAMLFERHKEDMRRYYTYHDRVVEQQQSKMEPGIHHHTHHHQTSSSSHHPYSKKDDHLLQHKQQQHYSDRAAASPAKEHVSSSSKHSLQHSSSPKGGLSSSSKEYSSKKDQQSSKEEKKVKQEKPVESEGQKPTMETTGPPPPPTNSYAYLHPSYLQPPPHAFAHMGPFEPMGYRGNPMLAPPPHYANAPYAMHPQIRYVAPPPPHEDPAKLHHAPNKALDLLQQVSQNYTTTHKIHELAEHAIMSPTPTAPPTAAAPSTPTAVAAPTAVVPKGTSSSTAPPPPTPEGKGGEGAGGPRDASRSPPTQRHLHTHHHTHVGVGYPIYDPYSVAAQKTFT